MLSGSDGYNRTMQKRRDLAWVTDRATGEVVGVGVCWIDPVALTWHTDLSISENEMLHLPGIALPDIQPV